MRFNLLSGFTSHVIILVCASCYSQAGWRWLLNQWQHRFQKKDAMSLVEPPAPTPHCNSNAEPSTGVEQTNHQTNIESNINSLRLRQNDRFCSNFSETYPGWPSHYLDQEWSWPWACVRVSVGLNGLSPTAILWIIFQKTHPDNTNLQNK